MRRTSSSPAYARRLSSSIVRRSSVKLKRSLRAERAHGSYLSSELSSEGRRVVDAFGYKRSVGGNKLPERLPRVVVWSNKWISFASFGSMYRFRTFISA